MKKYLNLIEGKLIAKGLQVKGKLKKKKGDDKIIVTIALCAVGVALALLFKDSIMTIVNTLLDKAKTAITSMF